MNALKTFSHKTKSSLHLATKSHSRRLFIRTNASYQSSNGTEYAPAMTPISTDQTTSSITAPQKQISYRVSVFDALKFNGPAPERINARLAMAMMYPAALHESQTGETLLDQITHPDWKLVVLAWLILHATMVPILKGCKDEDFGWMSVRAEKVNGRFAMLGWASWIALEYVSNACFF